MHKYEEEGGSQKFEDVKLYLANAEQSSVSDKAWDSLFSLYALFLSFMNHIRVAE